MQVVTQIPGTHLKDTNNAENITEIDQLIKTSAPGDWQKEQDIWGQWFVKDHYRQIAEGIKSGKASYLDTPAGRLELIHGAATKDFRAVMLNGKKVEMSGPALDTTFSLYEEKAQASKEQLASTLKEIEQKLINRSPDINYTLLKNDGSGVFSKIMSIGELETKIELEVPVSGQEKPIVMNVSYKQTGLLKPIRYCEQSGVQLDGTVYLILTSQQLFEIAKSGLGHKLN
jgi:hypothetical protein